MKVHHFSCPSCGYESRHMLGTPDGDQILTDLNTEFAMYKLFVCAKEKKFVGANTLDPSFDGRCPSCDALLEEVSAEGAKCPRCGSALKVVMTKPLSAVDTST